MIRLCAALLLGLLAACQTDQTVAAFGATGTTWSLIEVNGEPFDARATLVFTVDGRVSGRGPCNRFAFTNAAPYPYFAAGPVMSTKMACPDLAAETAFFDALVQMTVISVDTDRMVLTNDAGGEMMFRPAD